MSTHLRRAAGLRTIVATSTGLPFAALEYLAAASLVVYVAGDSAWIAIAVAGLLILLAWAFFGELNGMYPTAAAMRRWMGEGIDDRVALSLTLTYLMTIVVVVAADAYIVGVAITHTLGQAKWTAPIWVAAALLLATFVNLRGIVVAGRTQAVVTSVVIVVTVTVAMIALTRHGLHLRTPLTPLKGHSGADFVHAVVLGIFLYAAFEWVTTTAEEVHDPNLIPRGMLISIGVLFVTCSIMSVAMSHFLSHAQLSQPYPQLILGRAAIGDGGLYVMMVVTVLTAMNTFNGGFLTASRFMYATAREGSLSHRFAALNESAVPWLPVVTLAGLSLAGALAVTVTGQWQVLIAMGAALEALLYCAAGFIVYRLRTKASAQPRPFRMWGGRPLALAGSVLFGLLGLAAATTVNRSTNFAPLIIIVVVAALSTAYVLLWAPRVRAQEEARRDAASGAEARREAASGARPSDR